MSRDVLVRLALTLGLMTTFGVAAAASTATSGHIGFMWPVGLASGALLLVPRRLVPYVGPLVGALAAVSFGVGGFPVDVAVGYGLAITAEAFVVRVVLTARETRSPRLFNTVDFGRLMAACGSGASIGAVLMALTSAATSHGTAWEVGAAAFVTHVAMQLILLGFFLRLSPHTASFDTKEHVAAWVNTVVIGVAVFLPRETPSLIFLVVPSLGWVALRASMREAILQLAAVALIAEVLTGQGRGPWNAPYLVDSLDPEFSLLPLAAFMIACSMVTFPFSASVGMQRRSAAQVLLERARSAQLVENAQGVAIMGIDRSGRITQFNPGAERILGYTRDEVEGRTTAMFHTDAEVARLTEAMGTEPTYQGLLDGMRDATPGRARDLEFVRKDGVPRILSTIISPIHDEDDTMIGYVATADDVTDRIATERALQAALRGEREAVERLTRVDEVKDQFVSTVSHELRTPITNIVGYLELLMDRAYGDDRDEEDRALARIDANSRRLLTLIDDLLTLSHVESVDQLTEHEPVDLVAVVLRAEDMARPSVEQRDLSFEVDVPSHPVITRGNASQLERLFLNLTTNAVKFTDDGGRVVVRLRAARNGNGPVVEVEDNGVGIPEQDQEMLFSRFFRATQARAAAVQGSGLGLSIAKSIADLHGARISARSVPGAGSTFRVEFPAEHPGV